MGKVLRKHEGLPALTAEASGYQMRLLVEEARREWLLAQRYFDSVSDPELVDHATYLLKATERRYVYLLRKAGDLAGQKAH